MGAKSELQARRKDGSLFPVDIGLSPLPKRNGADVQVAFSIRDITEPKQAEIELKAAKLKAEDATRLKSMFLANMSHQIRTPMNAIIRLSRLALQTPLTAKQRDYVSKVHNAGTSLLAIINDILDFSKIEAARLDVETTDFRLDDVVSSVTTVTAQKATDKGLEILAHVSPHVLQSLIGDPHRLRQILTNREAVAAVQQADGAAAYDVVFMDWRMPGMDGLQAARTLKSDASLNHPPAIVIPNHRKRSNRRMVSAFSLRQNS